MVKAIQKKIWNPCFDLSTGSIDIPKFVGHDKCFSI